MRKTGRAARLMLGIGLTVLLLCATGLSAFAADSTDIDLEKKGLISLTLYSDETGEHVTDGALTLYKVAELTLDDGSIAYAKTDAFAGFTGELDIQDADLAGELSAYVLANGITGTARAITGDGVSFIDLTLGLYLLMQTEQSTGYYTIDPVLVTVPLAQDGVWVYHVDAGPKVEVYAEPEPEPEPTPKPGPTMTLNPDKTLPQTGQLFWPVPVLTGAGLMLIVVGNILRRKKRAA